MKWIKTRQDYLNEAKLRDVLLPPQITAVSKDWGEKWLDLEALEPEDVTPKIKQGVWKLQQEDKYKVLNTFFLCDIEQILVNYKTLKDHFCDSLMLAIDNDFMKNTTSPASTPIRNAVDIMENFNPKAPTLNQVIILQEPILRKPSISESKGDAVILRDENGRPLMDENGKILKRKREEGEIIFSKNACNINAFLEDYNLIFPENNLPIDTFTDGGVLNLCNLFKEDPSQERYKVEYDVLNRDMFLSIKHDARDILNISVSKFFRSCQHLYTGSHKENLLGNVFDPNTIPAFLLFDTPIHTQSGELVSEKLPIGRMLIRNIIDIDNPQPNEQGQPQNSFLLFDRAYPDKMDEVLREMIEKYSKNEGTTSAQDKIYVFTPDIPSDYVTKRPYLDKTRGFRSDPVQKPLIGVNTKKLYLKSETNWKDCIISPRARIEELVIETPDLPSNFFDINLNLNWIKFLYLNMNSMENFKNIKTDSLAFERCKIDDPTKFMSEIQKMFSNLKKLQFTTCKLGRQEAALDFSVFENLEELQLVFTFDSNEVGKILSQLPIVGEGTKRKFKTLKKLTISGDVFNANKAFINEFKGKGLKVDIVGPVI